MDEPLLHFVGSILVIALPQNLDALDHGRVGQRLGLAWIPFLDLGQHIHPLDHAPENCVFAVQRRCGNEADKELRTTCMVRRLFRHAEAAREVVARVIVQAFAVDFVPRTARSVSVGATALSHETWQHSMKAQPIVKAPVRETQEVAHCFGQLRFQTTPR